MIEHVTLNVTGAAGAGPFYRSVLGSLGYAEEVDTQGRRSFGTRGEFGVYESREAFFHGTHIAFRAASRGAVDRFHEAALAAGGTSVDPPRARPEFGSDVYSAYVLDPAGNGIEVICRECPDSET
jgi:catechol 2,3-dioxygenase-like lactoylglutathione lyase family enzyme